MEGTDTDSLRALAPKWSLAGDDHLLNLLQNTHQNIISKCQDVNSKLEEMASALDDASIHLQNVNNKFMALSNSQFIESRVYDDDEELTETQPVKEPPAPPPVDELSALRSSISVLEREHDTAEIMDESDSDSDTEISLVLKPKDKYAHRPLPHIIGTPAWRNKWHAGLIVDDSDTDSSTSKRSRDVEIYSDSESDTAAPEIIRERTISETSSSLPSDRPTIPTPPPQKPADIAAELARRLGGGQQAINPNRQEYPAPVPTTKTVYKPEKPAASTIFFDEPPPLPEETHEPDTQSEDEDIFAEINKRKPYTQRSTVQPNLAEDLFSFDKPKIDEGDIFSDFATTQGETKTSAKQKSNLFQDELEPELFVEQPFKKDTVQNNNNNIQKAEITSKKPAGGISLFGTNKGAESIGAAILKRNRRKSSTSGDESGSDAIRSRKSEEKSKNIEKTEAVAKSDTIDGTDGILKKEKDIFDDLFAKSEVKENKLAQKIVREPVKHNEKKTVKDLFSDNIFDDIDDIFTSNVKIPSKESNQKSIFDDDDDLFSDIAKPQSNITDSKSSKFDEKEDSKNKNSIFDSGDDLFNNIKPTDTKSSTKIESKDMTSVKNDQKVLHESKVSEAIAKEENIVKSTATTKERNLFDDSPQIQNPKMKQQFKSKSIFDSDSDDDDDIFANVKISDKTSNTTESVLNSNEYNKVVNSKEKSELDHTQLLTTETKEKSKIILSPTLFEEEEIDDLFINANKLKAAEHLVTDTKTAEVPSIEKDSVVVKDTVIVKDTVFDKDSAVVKETVITKDTTTTVNKFTLPEGGRRFIETQQNLTENSILIPKQIADADNFENLFSTSNIPSKDIISSKNVPIDIAVTQIIASSHEVNELTKKDKTDAERKNEIKGTFKDSVKTDIHFEDVTSNDARETEIVETHKQKEEEDFNQSIFHDPTLPVREEETLKTEHKKPVPNEADIFDDIFTEPPEFEKPAESKKSKNVNALFDDDSDDESMFFKKNDVISDEKPEIFSSNANFDIFVDEPPAIEVDFSPKSTKKVDHSDSDDLFGSVPKMQETVLENVIPETKNTKLIDTPKITSVPETEVDNNRLAKHVEDKKLDTLDTEKYAAAGEAKEKVTNTLGKGDIDSDDDLFSNLPKPNIPTSTQIKPDEQFKSSKRNVVETQKPEDEYDDIFKPKESPSKKIGKLNTKNFNINVNALIPGASPKKVPKELKSEQNGANQESDSPKIKLFPSADEIDFQPKTPSNKNENERSNNSKLVIEQNDVKTTAFEENAESEVLDNKASKQRARIQVKRKPSSRRARHEAVRKSAIDLYDDTDNSSSFDEPVKSKNKNSQIAKPVEEDTDILNQIGSKVDRLNDTQTEINASETLFETSTKTLPDTKKDQNEVVPSISSEIDAETKQNVNEQKTSTTKVVYILNDEDIFETGSRNIEKGKETIFGNKEAETGVDDFFGTNNTKSKDYDVFRTKNIETKYGGDYSDSKKTETKDDDDLFGTKNVETIDDDIFKSIQGVKTLEQTYNDHTKKAADVTNKDENDIQNATANVKNGDNIIRKGVKSSLNVKTSLFEDSDEELFNNKKKVIKKTTIFDSDSEEDLFSGKKRTEKQNKEQKNREVKERKEVIVKKSLFGDDDDDDLFGTKMDKTVSKIQSSKPSTSKETAVASKTSELVFDDPLSMLGDDD